MKIKICGVIREDGVRLVSRSGADYLGLLVDMPSPRTLDAERAEGFARLAEIEVALLFYNKGKDDVARIAERIGPAAIQLQGEDTPEAVGWLKGRVEAAVWKAVPLPAAGTGEADVGKVEVFMREYAEAGADCLLFDTFFMEGETKRMGGTGKRYDWETAGRLAAVSPLPVIVAGGLNAENVREAVLATRPYGVDVASGVEAEKGIKDGEKVERFMEAARGAEREISGK